MNTPIPDSRKALLDILSDQRITTNEARADLIEQLFKTEPVNYKRVYSDNRESLPELKKGDDVVIVGIGSFTIEDTSVDDDGATTLHLKAK